MYLGDGEECKWPLDIHRRVIYKLVLSIFTGFYPVNHTWNLGRQIMVFAHAKNHLRGLQQGRTVIYMKMKNQLQKAVVEELVINDDVKQVLLGSLMGDAYLPKPTKNASYTCTHCPAQREYLLWKASILKRNFRIRVAFYGKDKIFNAYVVRTNCSPSLTLLHRLFYVPYDKPGRRWRKIITKEILGQLTPLGIAVWYGDDGTYNVRDRACSLSTQGFSYEENLLIREYFLEKWGIGPVVTEDYSKEYDKTYYRIDFRASEAKKFILLIKDALPSCMVYKLGHYTEKNNEIMLKEDLRYKEIARKWYYDNHDRALGRASKYRDSHREEINRKRVDYYWSDPMKARESGRESMQRRRLLKRAKVNLINHEYYKRNKERIRAALKERLRTDPEYRERKNRLQMESYYRRKLKKLREGT